MKLSRFALLIWVILAGAAANSTAEFKVGRIVEVRDTSTGAFLGGGLR